MARALWIFAIPTLWLSAQGQDLSSRAGVGTLDAGYVVYQRIRISQQAQGIDGELQLLQDARLPTTPRTNLWGRLEPFDFLSSSRSDRAQNAILRIVTKDGGVTEQKRFERALAEMEEVRLYGDARVSYMVTVDYNVGFGKYNGPGTSILEIVGGHLTPLEASDKATGKREPIELLMSIRAAWKLGDARQGRARDIFYAVCAVKSSPGDATLDAPLERVYRHYSFDGSKWIMAARHEKGCFEFYDPDFPDLKLFP